MPRLPPPPAWRPVPFVMVLGGALAWRGCGGPPAPNASAALAAKLAERGLVATPDDVAWIDRPRPGLAGALGTDVRAVVRAAPKGELTDLYLVSTRLSPEGVLLGVGGVHDLTRTTGADETRPVVDGTLLAYATEAGGIVTGVHAIDLAGERDAADLGRVARAQVALTNLQETGQLAGVQRRAWSLEPAAVEVRLRVDAAGIEAVADGRLIRFPRAGLEPLDGKDLVREQPTARARPGNVVTWAVDRVRAMPWFGDDRMQVVKAVAFAALDAVARARGAVLDDETASEVARDLGEAAAAHPVAYTDPETGWPPPPMQVAITPPLPGEGEWVAIDRDPFVLTNPGVPAAFVTSFIRTDRERRYARIYVTLWDPRQVELHMMAGTIEPVGATGEAGAGLVPRTPATMHRLVGALNGGFQAMHGEFGMMGDGVVYLPPKPFGATVVALRDGSTGFGTWPDKADIPDEVLSYRQNLTPLVLDEKWNPYGRTWWGGTPPGWHDQTHTVRTGLCLTREGFVGYFYGSETAAETLAQAMIAARCRYGLHLDMNAGHSGLEFYRAAPEAELPSLARPLQSDWEAEGRVSGMEGWRFRGRRMIRGMGLMNFPRYIQREARDFFYLTLRPVLPGAEVAVPGGAEPGEGKWTTRGLPQHGFPYALATTTLRADPARGPARVRVLRVDPRMVRAAGASDAPADAPTVVVFSGALRPRDAGPSLWLGRGSFAIADGPVAGATQLLAGLDPGDPAAARAPAALGVSDDDGMLVYVDAAEPEAGGAALDAVLARLGCTRRMRLPRSLEPALGGTTSLAGEVAAAPRGATVRLVRGEAPGARKVFEETPVVPASVWAPRQAQRVRYLRKPAAARAADPAVIPAAATREAPAEPAPAAP